MYDPAVIRDFVAGVLAGVFSPEPEEEIWQWAERVMRIPKTENPAMAGRLWRSYYSPYVREVMEWAKQPGKGEMWIRKSSQVGVTMAALIIVCWFVAHRGGGIGYAADTVEEARRISKTRLKKWLKENKLLDEIGEDGDELGNLTYYLSGCTVYMMGGKSSSAFANKSTVLFILDELDEHDFIEGQGTTSDLARDRCKVPKNSKILGFCTPGVSGLITKEFKAGTQEEIRFPFPCCGHEQALEWDHLIFSSAEFRDLADDLDLELVEKNAYFKCQHCGEGRLYDHQKMKAMQSFRSVATNPKAPARVRSMQLWDAYSNFVTFGQLAIEWLKAQGDDAKLERFMRSRRGLPFERSGGAVTNQELLELRGAYRRGECPPGVDPALYVMAVDIQDGFRLKAVKAVFDAAGNLYVIDWGEFVSLDELEEFADEPLETPSGAMVVQCGLLDEGNDKEAVWNFSLATRPRFFPVKGRGGRQVKSLVATSRSWFQGQEVLSYHIDDSRFKWSLLNSLRRKHYSEKRQEEIARIVFPEDAAEDADFLTEFTKELPIKVKNKYGVEVWEWVTKGPNDFWDAVKYIKAIWVIMSPALGMEAALDAEEPETPEAA